MKALFVTYDKCPDMDAGAVRVHMLANMFKDSGYDITIVSMGPYTGYKSVEVDGIKFISFRSKSNKILPKASAYILFPIRLYHFLKQDKWDVCIHTQIGKGSLDVIKKYCKKNNSEVIYDAVEWFSPEQFVKGEKSRVYIKNNNYNTKLIQTDHKVIAISKYLEKYFLSRNIRTIRIPAVLDIKNTHYIKDKDNEKTTLIYAGTPGKKDYLNVVIEALTKLDNSEKSKLSFVIIGCNEKQLVEVCNVKQEWINNLKNIIHIKGRMTHDEVLKEYMVADFSIIMRSQNQRYAKAGFPTKFVESLSMSTPVICNLTSDLADYIDDKANGVIVKDETVQACYEAFKYIVTLTEKEKLTMQNNAKKTAVKYFDYRIYTKDIVEFANR